jgi:hypothetical protein
MATYYPLEYWILIPKGIEVFLFIVLAIKIARLRKYVLNQIFCVAFLLWAGYIIINSIIYITAAESELAFLVDTVLSAVAISCGLIVAYLIFMATQVILEGAQEVNKTILGITGGLTVGMAVLIFIFQKLEIVDMNNNPLLTVADWATASMVRVAVPVSPIALAVLVYPMILYLYSIVSLLRLVRTKVKEGELRRRMYYLLAGISLLLIGMVYFVIIQLLYAVDIVTSTIGHGLWILAPIFIWESQQGKEKPPQ